MHKLSLKAVIAGGVVDVVASSVLGLVFTAVVISRLGIDSLAPPQRATVAAAAMSRPTVFLLGWLVGGLCNVLGGYVAACIADRGEVLNGAVSAWLCITMSAVAMALGSAIETVPQLAATVVLTPVLGALGGYLRARQRQGRDDAELASLAV